MTGIVFPNFLQSIVPLMQMEQNDRRNTLDEARMRRADDLAAKEDEAGKFFPAAVKGDPESIAKVMASPKHALPLMQYLDRADATKRTQMKEAAAWTGQAAMGVLSVPPEQRPAAYAAALADGQARGFDLKNMPPQYTPDVEGRLNFYANQARDVNKWFESQDNMPRPAGAGATTGAPGAAPSGNVLDRSAVATGKIEGNYDSVGPSANNAGNRAYGKYQVMDFNVGPWTQEVLGKPMTPQEFLANPQAQDAVYRAKFGEYVKKYGSPEAASRAWFAGEGGMNNRNAKDVLGTTVGGYGQKFAQLYGPDAYAPAPQLAQGSDMPRTADASGNALPQQGDALAPVRGIQLPPGARLMVQKGVPITKDGTVMIMKADGTPDFVPLPQRADPAAARPPQGYRQTADGALEFIPGGPADPTIAKRMSPMNNEQARDAGFADRMQNSNGLLDTLDVQGTKFWDRLASKAPGGAGTYVQSEDYQKFSQAKDDFINAQLRRESGAAINKDEYDKADRQYFPQPGDKPDTLKQKALNRKLAVEGMIRGAGPSYKASPSVGERPAPAAAPSAEPSAAPAAPVAEGATATNPGTGEKIIFRGGQWTPLR